MAEHNELGKWGEDEAALYLENEAMLSSTATGR